MTLNLQVMGAPPATIGIASLQLLTVSADKDSELVDHSVVNVDTEPKKSQENVHMRKKGNEKNSKQPTKVIKPSKKTKMGPKGENENADFNINSKKKEAVLPITKPCGRPAASKKITDRQASWALEQCLATEQLRFKHWAAKAKPKLQLSTVKLQDSQVQLNLALAVKVNYEAQFYDLHTQESYINTFTAANSLVTNKVLSATPILCAPVLPILSPRVVEEPKWDHSTWMEKYTVGNVKLQFMDEILNNSVLKTRQDSFSPLMDVGVQDLERNNVEADAEKLNDHLNDIDQASITAGPSGAAGENINAEG
ncbi:hypothetical protein K439DRAFT_1623964 [Ramaria rubella]|nr:hypothetical protein K439DRAFT_1623964 [Ramaria rubella]